MTTLQDWTDAFDAAIVANSVPLNEAAGTQMSYIMYTDPIYGTETLWTMVGLVKAADQWADGDWQATVTLADQAEGSDLTSSWTCRLTASAFDGATGTWGSLDTKFVSEARTTVKKKADGILTETGTWTETTTWLTSQWEEELKAYWETKMADDMAAEGDGAEGEGEGDAGEGEGEGTRRLQDEGEGAEGEGEGDAGEGGEGEGEGDAGEAAEPEVSLKDQYLAAMEDEETWGFDDLGDGTWLQWCGSARDVGDMSGEGFAIAAGDIGVTVTWTNIDSKGKAENADPSVTATTVTLAATELPSLEPPVVEETDDGTGETDEEGDSAAFIKATSVALGAFAVMLA